MDIYDTIVDILGEVPPHLIFIYDIGYIFTLIMLMIVLLSPLFFIFKFVGDRR